MKNNIKIANLSQIHVGSGEMLQNHTDFVVRASANGKGSDIYVIDPNRVGKLIGDDLQLFQQWAASIDKGDTNSFFQLYLKNYSISEYSRRRITNYAIGDNSSATLKECIHDGMGRPYIPGSSIKGAIRTAIIASLADKMPKATKENLVDVLLNEKKKYMDEDGMHSSAENVMLGDTPNENLMRFIRVGDAFYERGSEVAVNQISLNETHRDNLKDKSKMQAVEAIAEGEESSFLLAIDKDKYDEVYKCYKQASLKGNNIEELKGMKRLPSDLSSIPLLFKLINEHTKKLVESEINYWNDLTQNQGAEYYIESMNEILDSVSSCKDGECVLRLGQAIGWRFITGAWTEGLDNFYGSVVPIARPNNKRYTEYDFPKSRRMDDESYLFGFVKLSII